MIFRFDFVKRNPWNIQGDVLDFREQQACVLFLKNIVHALIEQLSKNKTESKLRPKNETATMYCDFCMMKWKSFWPNQVYGLIRQSRA